MSGRGGAPGSAGPAGLWRAAGVGLAAALHLADGAGDAGAVLVLVLAALAVARSRFPTLPAWTVLADAAACALALPFVPWAAFGLALPAFEVAVRDRYLLLAPAAALLAARLAADGGSPLPAGALAAIAAALLAGHTLRVAGREAERARRASDEDRRERYGLERLRDELVAAAIRGARRAADAERERLARDLHDHAVHEFAAARLALAAGRRPEAAGGDEGVELLAEADARLGRGIELLRSTARGLMPREPGGVAAFESICRSFPEDVELEVRGDTGRIPPHVWGVLEPTLKEALANAFRHGGPGRRVARLAVGPRIVRLEVENPGPPVGAAARGRPDPGGRRGAEAPGLGLRGLERRARAVGGSFAAELGAVYRLVCVLPLDEPGVLAGRSGSGPEAAP